MPAMWMPVEMTWSSLDFQTQWMYQDCVDNFPQSKTKAELQGMKPALKEGPGELHLREGGV